MGNSNLLRIKNKSSISYQSNPYENRLCLKRVNFHRVSPTILFPDGAGDRLLKGRSSKGRKDGLAGSQIAGDVSQSSGRRLSPC